MGMEEEYLSDFQKRMEKKSAYQVYKDYWVGGGNFVDFLKYELITSFFGHLPGSFGYFMRKKVYRSLFEEMGGNALFGKSVTLANPKKIKIGRGVIINDYCSLLSGEKGIELGDNVMISRNTFLSSKRGNHLKIGENSRISFNCAIISGEALSIGRNVLIGGYSYIIGQFGHRMDRTDIPMLAQGFQTKGGITIEDDVLVGAGVKVLDGVKIGKGSVIGAGSVVTKDIPDYSIAVGVPAKVIKKRV